MTEKEFLITFMKFCKDKTNKDLDVPEKDRVDIDEKLADKYINCFFEQHHKEYYEVEFVKKEDDPIHVKRVSPIEITKQEFELMQYRKEQMEKALEKKDKLK